MAWITTKIGKHINTDWFDDDTKQKERQIKANEAERDTKNAKPLDLSSKSYKDTKEWFKANSNYTKWEEQMEEDEYYDTLGKYSGEYYSPINHYLRKGEFTASRYYEKDDMIEDIQEMDKAISAFELKQPITVYRKSDSSMFGKNDMSYEQIKALEGKVFSDKAYVSASTKSGELPGEQTVTGNMYYHIDVPAGRGNGAYVAYFSENHSEREFILKRGSKYQVTKVVKDADGITVVYMRML